MNKQHLTLTVIAEVSGKQVTDIEPEMNLVADLGIDSPKALHLLSELEEKLHIEITDEDAAKMNTVADIISYAANLR